jgi:16S rRNA (guanine527-N7)-methyltransferase
LRVPSATAVEIGHRFNVSRESLTRLERYVGLIETWQRRINLIGRSTADDIWSRHIADSLQLLDLFALPFPRVADLGSGAGMPGLVLAIARPLETHLFESNLKKGAFLREAARQTGASARVHAIRIEAAGDLVEEIRADVVTARGLAPLSRLLGFATPFIERGAVGYFHKGQNVDAELTEATKSWKVKVTKYPSVTDSRGCILGVKEALRVA